MGEWALQTCLSNGINLSKIYFNMYLILLEKNCFTRLSNASI